VPPTVDNPQLSAVRGTECILPKDVDWVETTAPWREAFNPGPPPEYASPGLGGSFDARVPIPARPRSRG
jgi:hypothetical protein